MKVGDIVRFKEEHYLSHVIKGYCIVDDLKIFQFRPNKPNRYHIKTLNKDSVGSYSMAWVDEHEIISISDIRENKLNQLGIF
jgi:hypothetical protein